MYRTLDEAFETFGSFDKRAEWEKHFKPWERYLVSRILCN